MSELAMTLASAAGNVSGGTPPSSNAWDISYAELESDSANAWDVSTATYVSTQSGTFGTDPFGVAFKTDGTKLYTIAYNSNAIYEHSLSTAWDITTSSYTTSFSVGSQEIYPSGLVFKPDGTKMYIIGFAGDDVNEYDLSTAWDISTASFSNTTFSVQGQETSPRGLFFKSDGTKLYVTGQTGDDVNEYTLSTGWDLSTASYSQNFSVAAQEAAPQDVHFKSDGTKMYIIGTSGDDVNEYNLSTAWDDSTASYSQNFSVSTEETYPRGMFFRPNGLTMYVVGSLGDDINQYNLGKKVFNVASQEASPNSLAFKSDGTKMYVVGGGGVAIDEYNLSTAWDINTATYSQQASVGAQDTSPQGLYIKSDGTAVYVLGLTGDDVNQYSLSTAWDISTLSYVRNFSIAAKELNPTGVDFKSDGTEMYITGVSSDAVHQYSLSTAWDISTASFTQSFSVSGQFTEPSELRFKPDGTKMYVLGQSTNKAVSEYNLSTAWDISTASYSQQKAVLGTTPTGLFFKTDGTQMYVLDRITDDIYQYIIE